ncbi:hypothetical protein SAMN03159448_01423 [Sinorhizobium sp. NFACC03]|nr:hypothetical protein SAMN03159448_01423 [Sinorhizobium sp. NFACC03]
MRPMVSKLRNRGVNLRLLLLRAALVPLMGDTQHLPRAGRAREMIERGYTLLRVTKRVSR